MPKLLQSCVDEVKRRAAIEEVVPAWGVVLKRKGASLVGLCPFHEEKSGSFTVRPGKGFVCFGCGAKGDAVGFVMKKEGIEFIPAIERLADKFGVLLQYEAIEQRTSPAAAGDAQAGNVLVLPKDVDPATAKRAIARQARYEREREQEDRLENALLDAWRPTVQRRKLWPWSSVVKSRWEGAGSWLGEMSEAFALSRGWPTHWFTWLVEADLIAWPALPWNEHPAVALKVEAPKYSGPGSVRELVPIGYHQRFTINEEKSWVYVPYLPENVRTDFQRAMVAVEMQRGAEEGVARCPGLPFVMGNPASPLPAAAGPGYVPSSPSSGGNTGIRFLVITEGQWDAVTFAGACGWLESETTWPEGVMVMGVRGANGVDTLLAYWGEWLEATMPAILVLADNDTAGRRWDEPQPLDKDVPGSPLLPTFAEKLLKRPVDTDEEARLHPDGWVPRARKVTVQRVNAVHGKDFNDYWKAKRPNAAALMAWLKALGYIGERGEWP